MEQEIIEQLTVIFKDILDNESIELNRQTTADDIDEWDSLSHIQLMVAIERHFKIRFTSKEIQLLQNVGEMIDSVISKM